MQIHTNKCIISNEVADDAFIIYFFVVGGNRKRNVQMFYFVLQTSFCVCFCRSLPPKPCTTPGTGQWKARRSRRRRSLPSRRRQTHPARRQRPVKSLPTLRKTTASSRLRPRRPKSQSVWTSPPTCTRTRSPHSSAARSTRRWVGRSSGLVLLFRQTFLLTPPPRLISHLAPPPSPYQLYTVVQHVKHFNDVVEFGENQEFTDDFEYLATGLKSGQPLNTRCLRWGSGLLPPPRPPLLLALVLSLPLTFLRVFLSFSFSTPSFFFFFLCSSFLFPICLLPLTCFFFIIFFLLSLHLGLPLFSLLFQLFIFLFFFFAFF